VLRFLVIGAGQCGNRIVDTLMREGYGKGRLARLLASKERAGNIDTLAINTSKNDLMELTHLRDNEKLHVPGSHGAGANREQGKQSFEDNRELITEKLGEYQDHDMAFVVTSAGGGTGSSFSPHLVELLKDMEDVPVFPFVVLPFRSESEIFIQNAGFSLKDLRSTRADSTILASNDYIRRTRGEENLYDAYQTINDTIAHRLLFLMNVLSSEMMISADLGDMMTALETGSGFSTMGFARGSGHEPIKEVIRRSWDQEGLLFDCDPKTEAARSLFLAQGPKDRLEVDSILDAITEFGDEIGDVFKGVRVAEQDQLEVLSLFSLRTSETLENVIEEASRVLEQRRQRMQESADQKDELTERFEGVDDYSLE
jgi:cell division GTPase FtsZ